MAGVQNNIADLIDDEAECSNNGSSERDSFSEDERDKYFINDEDSFSTESYNHRSYEHMDEMHGEKYGHTYLESVLDDCENGEINKMYGASGLEESKKFNANAFTNGIVYPEPKPSRKLKDTQWSIKENAYIRIDLIKPCKQPPGRIPGTKNRRMETNVQYYCTFTFGRQ